MATPCSNCVYKGTKWCGIICGKWWLVSLLLLFFAVSSWAACTSTHYSITRSNTDWTCYPNAPIYGCNGEAENSCPNLQLVNGYVTGGVATGTNCGYYNSWHEGCERSNWWQWRWTCTYSYLCDTQSEADSLYCELNPDDPSCTPQVDSTACDTYRSQCAQLGGVFEGEPLEDGCSATCNTCGNEANKKIMEVKSRSCCSQGLAPSIDLMCTTPLESGIGMTVSSNANLECSDPNLSDEALQSYVDNCSNNNNSNPESSESGPTSSEGGSSAGPDSAGLGQDYYPILDTIRDSLLDIRRNVETITTCLVSPGTCAGLMGGGDTIIVNASDSTYIKQLGTKLDGLNSTLDTSVQNSNERLQESINFSISRANDSLIDSMRKYLNSINSRGDIQEMDSANRFYLSGLPGKNASAIGSALGYGDTASTNLRGDLNAIRAAIERLGDTSGLGGYGGGYGDSVGRYRDSINKYYISDGRFGELVDSTEAAWGVDSLDARWDSSFAYGQCNGDDCPPCSDDSCMGRITVNLLSQSDSIASELAAKLQDNVDSQRSELPTFWDSTFAELKKYSWFGSFDSTFLANIGAKIPNSNICPEHCFVQDVNGTYAYVGYNMHLDWKLCRPIAPDVLNSLNAFDILKLLARIITVVTCLSILMWEVSSRRGGGIGL